MSSFVTSPELESATAATTSLFLAPNTWLAIFSPSAVSMSFTDNFLPDELACWVSAFSSEAAPPRVFRVGGHATDDGGDDLLHRGFGDIVRDAELLRDVADGDEVEHSVEVCHERQGSDSWSRAGVHYSRLVTDLRTTETSRVLRSVLRGRDERR